MILAQKVWLAIGWVLFAGAMISLGFCLWEHKFSPGALLFALAFSTLVTLRKGHRDLRELEKESTDG